MADILSILDTDSIGSSSDYLGYLGVNLKVHEIQTLRAFVQDIESSKLKDYIFDKYILGYSIPQISKEFDLLRFSEDTIVNIELKSRYDYQKILTQLQRNHLYLKPVGRSLHLMTYAADTRKVYKLSDDTKTLEIIDFDKVSQILSQQLAEIPDNIDHLFSPSQDLVSPFNSPREFINKAYFLTSHQDDIRVNITKILLKESHSLISLEGKPGTGKTLLMYDIARSLAELSKKKMLIIHVGHLNDGHASLSDIENLDIIAIKSATSRINDLSRQNYESIFIDETQRINYEQLRIILEKARIESIGVVTGFDRAQTLSGSEANSGSIKLIEARRTASYILTEKIRTNKNTASFISMLFAGKKVASDFRQNVSVVYFSDLGKARRYINSRKDYQLLTYTPSRFSSHPIDSIDISSGNSMTAHRVIGQEFENVITIIDNVFYYDDSGMLNAATRYGVPYSQRNMLFQIVTRTRNKLEIVVVDNKGVFNRIISHMNQN